jgi:lipopolysaccharide/colanic/teichoic acid biosynthesis glycosyltransferase
MQPTGGVRARLGRCSVRRGWIIGAALFGVFAPLIAGADDGGIWPVVERPAATTAPARNATPPGQLRKLAQSPDDSGRPIPEPSSLIVFAAGLLVSARWLGHRPAIARPLTERRTALRVKRAIDVVGASLGLLLALPIFLLAAAAIRLESRGPALFRQTRIGQGGRPFKMWKLRSMVAGAEELRSALISANEMDGPVFKIRSDPRVTRVGRVLRRFSIDELPQLWNVIRGEMSLVGPRPPLPCEVECYGELERRRLAVKPGLTCEWQVSGRNQIGFSEWMRLDAAYIENWSLSRDVRLLLRTLTAVGRGTGAS